MSSSFRDWRRDWNTIRSLRGRKLFEYLLDYYTVPFFVIIFAIYVVIAAANMLWEGQKPTRLQVCVVLNNDMSCRAWFDEFFENLRSDGKPGKTVLNENQPFDYNNHYFQVQEAEVMALVSSRRIDVAVCGEDLYSYLLALDVCMELSEIFVEEPPAPLVHSTAGINDDRTSGYYALDLTSTAFAARYNHKSEDGALYAVIISNTEHLDDVLILLNALAVPANLN